MSTLTLSFVYKFIKLRIEVASLTLQILSYKCWNDTIRKTWKYMRRMNIYLCLKQTWMYLSFVVLEKKTWRKETFTSTNYASLVCQVLTTFRYIMQNDNIDSRLYIYFVILCKTITLILDYIYIPTKIVSSLNHAQSYTTLTHWLRNLFIPGTELIFDN